MKRRDLLKSIVPVGASFLLGDVKHIPDSQAAQKPPAQDSDLTRYAAEFALKLKYEDIPAEIVSLGKKSILDGFGLALAGSMAQSGHSGPRRKLLHSSAARRRPALVWLLS